MVEDTARVVVENTLPIVENAIQVVPDDILQ